MRILTIIVAAGRGERAADPRASRSSAPKASPKQYADLADRAVLARALMSFEAHPRITDTVVVIHADDNARYSAALADYPPPARITRHPPVVGGETRQASVRCGLDAMARLGDTPFDYVLIHDAARPFIDHDVIDRVIDALRPDRGALASLPVHDTLKQQASAATDEDGQRALPLVAATPQRDGLWRAQTPQGFPFAAIHKAHQNAEQSQGSVFTDDAAIAEASGLNMALVTGSERNFKITTAADMALARTLAATDARPMATATNDDGAQMETRIGSGFDIHRFAPGDHVWLGGVRIAHTARLDGHSDADVALHALTDALLGAIGDGDIGQHFPPSDPKWKGASSLLFLDDAAQRVAARGGRIINVDITILAEAPKVGPHRVAMQQVIATALGIAPDRIGIKATTMEQLGSIGRSEGIAAMATASVIVPGR